MAGASDKKLAQRNIETLKSIHLLSLIINGLSLLSLILLKRPSNGLWKFMIFSIPSWGLEYMVEKLGRPTFKLNENGYEVLVKPGDDLQQQGLTEYMIDIIYLTLIIDVLNLLFNWSKFWYLLLLIPVFAIYKTKWIWSRFIPSLGGSRRSAGDATANDDEQKMSKRQMKLEKRNKNKVTYSR